MDVPFRQTTKGGCGVYALANLFNEPMFLQSANLEVGHGIHDLNRLLDKLKPEHYIRTMFCTNSKMGYNRLNDSYIFGIEWNKCQHDEKENYVRPFLITYQGSLRNHCILVLHRLKDDLFYIVDSLRDRIEHVTVSALLARYHILTVETIELWEYTEQDDVSCFFYQSYLSHLLT